jgi:pimeloyl-ACP methyl ester carboxylesterase
MNLFGKIDEIPIMFEDISIKETPEAVKDALVAEKESDSGEGHLFVFVHGFQGNSWDTKMMKNVVSLRFNYAQLLCSVDNEGAGATEGDIQEMGRKLANEVISYIKEWLPGKNLNKITFWGHSLGGIIIRTALPLLSDYQSKMHSFLTFSSPHLGCMYQSSKLVSMGMWVLKKWKTSTCLDQLALSDNKDVTQTFMYKLSSAPVFNKPIDIRDWNGSRM